MSSDSYGGYGIVFNKRQQIGAGGGLFGTTTSGTSSLAQQAQADQYLRLVYSMGAGKISEHESPQPKSPKASNNQMWLDRRVNEMRVKL